MWRRKKTVKNLIFYSVSWLPYGSQIVWMKKKNRWNTLTMPIEVLIKLHSKWIFFLHFWLHQEMDSLVIRVLGHAVSNSFYTLFNFVSLNHQVESSSFEINPHFIHINLLIIYIELIIGMSLIIGINFRKIEKNRKDFVFFHSDSLGNTWLYMNEEIEYIKKFK